MQSPRDFKKQFKRLLLSPVAGMSWDDKLAFVRAYMRELEARTNPEDESTDLAPSLEIVPFEPGRRPIDEGLGPGLGASEQSALVSTAPNDPKPDDLTILYHLKDLFAYVTPFQRPVDVRLSVDILPHVEGHGAAWTAPALTDVPVEPQVISAAAYPF